MPKQAYIARQDSTGIPSGVPISESEWLAALRAVPGLTVVPSAAGAEPPGHTVQVPSGACSHFSLAASGMIAVDNPNRVLMDVRFSLAPTLNAGLYSAQLRPYQSLRDWERRATRQPPDPRQSGQPRRRRSRRWRVRFSRRHALFVAVGVGILLLSLVLGMRAGV